MGNKYIINKRTDIPIIKELRSKYEEMFLMGDIQKMCKEFGVDEHKVRNLIYSTNKKDQVLLNFDTIIKLSYMFDIPYEEFINYNAYIDYYRNHSGDEEFKEADEMLKQYTVGKQWEEDVIQYYADKGYFVYKIPTLNSGTVFDILAIKNGGALCIECKHIEEDRLYYASSGLLKKTDEIDHFVDTTGNNVYIYIKSDTSGTFWTTWIKAKPILQQKGYIDKNDCFTCILEQPKVIESGGENEEEI